MSERKEGEAKDKRDGNDDSNPDKNTGVDPQAGVAELREAWRGLLAGLDAAEEQMIAQSQGLPAWEQADGYRALVRALMNQLGRFEVDRANPELVPYNGWREKFFMDNPDFLYWVADVSDASSYRIWGNVGAAKHTSITAYSAQGLADAQATARLEHDTLNIDEDGGFEVIVATSRPSTGTWLPLPKGANSIWVRGFYDDVYADEHGEVFIEPLDPVVPQDLAKELHPERFAHRLKRLGKGMKGAAKGMARAAKQDAQRPNQIRVWEEMQGGAVFTEPEIHYQRGGWELSAGQGLLLEIEPVACRYWNLMLYSRYLNSLDHRNRSVSLTGGRARVSDDGLVRVLLCENQAVSDLNCLDTEGRQNGIFVIRWLKPETMPRLPSLRVVELAQLQNGGADS